MSELLFILLTSCVITVVRYSATELCDATQTTVWFGNSLRLSFAFDIGVNTTVFT